MLIILIQSLPKEKKDNTYKFALAKFLIEYSYTLDYSYITTLAESKPEIIPFSVIAKSFLKYYWHQICKYKIKQNYNLDKLPLIVKIIHDVFGKEYIPESFESMSKEKITTALKGIEKKCFHEVIPRFQNISDGVKVMSKNIFYNYDGNSSSVNPNILKYLANHFFLIKTVLLEWSKFLEKINVGLPMLISKVEGYERQRQSLEWAKNILSKYFDKCFYCKNTLASEKQMIHVDHFVPWSYIFEDELWNLVLSCRNCNLKKHSSLPPYQYIELLAKRNRDYYNVIENLKKSLLKLEAESNYEKAIRKLFYNCADYGFTIINSL